MLPLAGRPASMRPSERRRSCSCPVVRVHVGDLIGGDGRHLLYRFSQSGLSLRALLSTHFGRESDLSQTNIVFSRFVNTLEASEFLRLSPRTLEKYRVLGGGPVYRKFGGRVIYDLMELQSWADERRRTSTSDTGMGAGYPMKQTRALSRR